jgi:hypothetical protein
MRGGDVKEESEQLLEKAEDQKKYVARIRNALGRGWKGVKPQKGSSQYEIEKAANSLRCGKLILRFAFGRYWNKKQVMIYAETFDREVEKIGVSKTRPPDSAVNDIRRRLLPQAMARQVEIEKEVKKALEYRREKDRRFRKLAAAGGVRFDGSDYLCMPLEGRPYRIRIDGLYNDEEKRSWSVDIKAHSVPFDAALKLARMLRKLGRAGKKRGR